MSKALYNACSTCWHIIGHMPINPNGRWDRQCHCGCVDWIPQNNLEVLERVYEKNTIR